MKLASLIKSCGSLFVPVVSTTQPNFSPIATATTAVIVSPGLLEVTEESTQLTIAPGLSFGRSLT